MQRDQLKNLNESIDIVFLKENVYSLLGVPADFDINNKEHANLLKNNYRALTFALHPDGINRDNPNSGKLFSHVKSAYDFLKSGSTTTPRELFVGTSHEIPITVSPRIRLTRSDLDRILNTAHGGEHWKPKEGKTISRDTGLDHVLSWEEEQNKHHGKINDALVSIYNPTSGERRNPGGRSSSTSSTRTHSPPPPNSKPTVMDRPPIRGNDTHSQYLHAALGTHETFLDPDHVGDTSPASDMHSGQFKTKNQNLAHLYRTMFSNGPKHGFVVRSPFHSEDRVQGYVADGGNPVENFSHQTHHLSMILDPAYTQRAIASAHSSHRNFRESFRQQHGRSATDQDLDAAIKAGTIRGVGLPAEEEEQKLVLRHIHALQMAAIHHPDVHANDLVSILQRKTSSHSDTESDRFGPRGTGPSASSSKPKLQEDENLQELQVAAIAKLLHNHPVTRQWHNQVVYPSGSRTNPTGVSRNFITSSTQQAANLWDQYRKDINAKTHPLNEPPVGANEPVTPHHIDTFNMHPSHPFNHVFYRRLYQPVDSHEGRYSASERERQAHFDKFQEELQRIKKVHNSETEGHILLGIHHPDALVRQIAGSYVDVASRRRNGA